MHNATHRLSRATRWSVFALAAFSCTAVVLGQATVSPQQADMAYAEKPKQLRVAIDQSVDTFNPFQGFFSIGQTVQGLTYDGLMTWGAEDFKPKPLLATKWTHSKDNLTWTYTIREGVKWTDGKPLTSKDVLFTYQTMMTNPGAETDLVKQFASVSAPNPTTFVVKLKQPTNDVLRLTPPIVPEHLFKSHLKDLGAFKNDKFPLVGSGPFQVVDFKPDQFIKLKANKDYWGGAPKYEELVFQYYKNPDAQITALKNGDVDVVTGLVPERYKALQNQPGITTSRGLGRRVHSITFNPGAKARNGEKIGDGHPALQDVRVRQAIHHAIDVDVLIDKVQDGMAKKTSSYVPAIFKEYLWTPNASEEIKFDLTAANRILDQAGYKKGADGVRVDPKSKRPLKFRLLAHSDEPGEATEAQYVEGWLKKIGIQVVRQSKDSGKLNDDLYAGKFDMIFSGWGGDPDPSSLLSLYTCAVLPPTADSDQRDTDTFYCNPEYDKLYNAQKALTDPAKRVPIVKAMQKHLYENAPEITIWTADVREAYRSDRWSGFVRQPSGNGMLFGQQGNWSYASATPVDPEKAGTKGANGRPAAASSNTTLIVGIVVLVVVLAAAGFFFMRRRRTADERE